MTKEVQETAGRLGIVLHDHLIISREGPASFKSLGLL
jgi:DNA repair protein RadC